MDDAATGSGSAASKAPFDMITVIAGLEMTLTDLGYPVKAGDGTRAATQLARELAVQQG